jgi:hypothetical protein
MRAVLLRQSRYLQRLTDRMFKKKWRTDDPLWISIVVHEVGQRQRRADARRAFPILIQ